MEKQNEPKNRLRTEFSPAEKKLMRKLAVRIGELRHGKGLSQADLGRKSHVSKNLISLIETSSSAPSIITIWRLAQALGITSSDLLQFDEPELDFPPARRRPRREKSQD